MAKAVIKYLTKEELIEALDHSSNLKQLLKYFGLSWYYSNKKRIKSRMDELQVDYSNIYMRSDNRGIRTSPIWKMNKSDFEELVKNSNTFSEIIAYFNFSNAGGNFNTLKKRIEEDNIDVSHIYKNALEIRKNNSMLNGEKIRKNINEIFIKDSKCYRGTVKDRILKDKLLEYKCDKCGNVGEWLGDKIVLVLDHINGVNNDNRLENLRFLCPNCNSQTNTFCRSKEVNRCINCNKVINNHYQRCKRCSNIFKNKSKRKVERPSYKQIQIDKSVMPMVAVGRKYGVSDNAVRKWIKSYEKELNNK